MKIQPLLKTSFYTQYKKNEFNQINQKNECSLALKQEFKKHVNITDLSSKFNINFSSSKNVKSENIYVNLENKIIETTVPKDESSLPFIVTPEYIEKINQVFKEDNIGKIAKIDFSASDMLNYLANKKQINLNDNNNGDIAFILDEVSLKNIKENNTENSAINPLFNTNVKIYCIETDENKAEKLVKEFKNLTYGFLNVKTIKKPENSHFSKQVDAKKLETIINVFAENKFPDDEYMQNKLVSVITRYLNDHLLVFSYAAICEKLKEQHKNIEDYVKEQGKTMDDVVYWNPKSGKSYDLINYLYAKTNNISPDKFEKNNSDIFYKTKDDKIYVILDDVCATGDSMLSAVSVLRNAKSIILAPIVGFKTGEERIKEKADTVKNINQNIKYMPRISYNDLGYIKKIRYKDDDLYYFDPVLYRNAVDKYMSNFADFKREDADFLMKHLKGGCGSCHSCVIFPYMIPDNSSELNAFIGGYFLNNDTLSANKAVNTKSTVLIISEEEYRKIKKEIESELR